MIESKTRIALIDHHRMVRECFAFMLTKQPEWQVVAQCSNYQEAVRLPKELDIQIALISMVLPDKDGLTLLRDFRLSRPSCKVVMLGSDEQHLYLPKILEYGAMGFVCKQGTMSDLINAIRTVINGDCYLSQESAKKLYVSDRSHNEDLATLSARELEIFRLLARGFACKKVAQLTDTMPKTVMAHRANIYKKLQVNNQFELVRIGLHSGLVQMEELV